MSGADNFLDEIDCGSFFDQIDDLVEFPTDNDCGLGVGSVNCADFSTIWSDPPNGLLDSDPIFAGNHSNSAASDLSAQVSVPYEDIVQMEWLSNFVEDSFAIGDDMMVKENYPIKKESPQNPFHSTSPVSVLESSTTTTTTSSSSSSSSSSVGRAPISLTGPQRARTKRPRPATFGPRPSIRIISPTSSFTGPTSQIVPESDTFADSHLPKVMGDDSDHMKKIFKKKKKTMINNSVDHNNHQPSGNLAIRKCMHCEITKTPQWRAGPMGPKTLCNACGVRYKSGRLFPEYRPAASPTFVPALHSNSHKKVVEMRTKTPLVLTESQPELVPNFHPGLDYV